MTKEEKKKGFKRIKKGGRRRQQLAAALNYISTGDDWICSAAINIKCTIHCLGCSKSLLAKFRCPRNLSQEEIGKTLHLKIIICNRHR